MNKKPNLTSPLLAIPGVGPKTVVDLNRLGIHTVSDLTNKDPEALYSALCTLHGKKIDRCALYVFRCAVYYASNHHYEPELLKWWNWKDH